MKTITLCTPDEYTQLPHHTVHAVKAIIRRGQEIGLIHVASENAYDFPGGGMEAGETITQALTRELKEEAGATLKPATVAPFHSAKYTLIYKEKATNTIIERHFTYYFCEIEETLTTPNLTQEEIDTGQRFVCITIPEAITTNEKHITNQPHWVENPTDVLRLLRDMGR